MPLLLALLGLLLVSGCYCVSARWYKEAAVLGAVLAVVSAIVLHKLGGEAL